MDSRPLHRNAALAALLLLAAANSPRLHGADAPSGLLFDLLSQPEKTVVYTASPTFGWIVPLQQPNDHQTAYRILVASSEAKLDAQTGDLWDSGAVKADASINVPYGGSPLAPGASGFWKVKTWDGQGRESPWSDPQSFHLAATLDETAQPRQNVETTDLRPVHSTPLGQDGVLLDFGRDAFGYLQLALDHSADGQITVRLGEKLTNGRIDPHPGGSIRYAEVSLPVTKEVTSYRVPLRPDPVNTTGYSIRLPPQWGVLMPFRYAELLQLPFSAGGVQATQTAFFYPSDDSAAFFTSSDPVLNQIWELSRYSLKATSFLGIYVDGDRERRPYEADAYIHQLGDYQLNREYALARYTQAYLLKHPTWPTECRQHAIFIAWADWMYTGDTRMLAQTYDTLKNQELLEDHFRNDGLLMTKDLRDLVDWPAGERDGYVMSPVNTVVNAFEYAALLKMSAIATALGKDDDARDFSQKAAQLKMAVNDKLRDPVSGLYLDGEGLNHSSLHATMFPLAFGLVPDDARGKAVDFVTSRGMACSVYGAQYLLEGLYGADADDAALALLTSQDTRSWMNMLKVGSTITMEAWDSRYKPNLDWNHAWGAAPANIIPRYILGVQPLAPGFSRILIAPHPGSLTEVEGTVPTIRGSVRIKYQNRPGASFDLEVTIPANATADIRLPHVSPGARLTLDGREMPSQLVGDHAVLTNVGSGLHVIGYR